MSEFYLETTATMIREHNSKLGSVTDLLSRWAAKQKTLHGPAAGFQNDYKLLIVV